MIWNLIHSTMSTFLIHDGITNNCTIHECQVNGIVVQFNHCIQGCIKIHCALDLDTNFVFVTHLDLDLNAHLFTLFYVTFVRFFFSSLFSPLLSPTHPFSPILSPSFHPSPLHSYLGLHIEYLCLSHAKPVLTKTHHHHPLLFITTPHLSNRHHPLATLTSYYFSALVFHFYFQYHKSVHPPSFLLSSLFFSLDHVHQIK